MMGTNGPAGAHGLRWVGRGLWHLASLPIGDQLALLRAGFLFSAAELAVRVVPLPRLAQWFGAPLCLDGVRPVSRRIPDDCTKDEHRLLVAVERLARRWPIGRGPCLRQSLAAGFVMRRHGARLRLGIVRQGAGDVIAHAWIEIDGQAVTNPRGAQFLPLSAASRLDPP